MGTRGTCGFIMKDEPKMGYIQFDSYPSGVGDDVLKMVVKINEKNRWDDFRKNASKMKQLNKEDINEDMIERYKKYSNLGVSEQSYYDPYCLLREIQGPDWIVEMINGELEHYSFDNDFIKDSLFCEYGYLINLDTMMLEYYQGFQKSPQENNPFGEENNREYYPCKLMDIVPLDEITEDTVSDIVNKWEEMEEPSDKVEGYLTRRSRKKKLETL